MSYKLEQPYTEKQKLDFIVEYNHQKGLRIETSEQALYALEPNEIMINGIPSIDPEFEAKQKILEEKRIAELNLTAADVERGIYKAKGMDFEDIINSLTNEEEQDIDIKALKIELKANHFYRGNPYVSEIGKILGFVPKQLDRFFETNDWQELVAASNEVE